MKRFIVASLLFCGFFQAVPATVHAKTPFDRSSVQGIFEEEDAYMDSRHLPLEEDYSPSAENTHH